jgi:hypothetical protein
MGQPAWEGVGSDVDLDDLPLDVRRDLRRLRPPPRIPAPVITRPAAVDPTGVTGPTPRQARGEGWRRTSKNRYVPVDAVFEQPAQRIAELAERLPDCAGITGWASLHLAGARWFNGSDGGGIELPVPLALGPMGKRRPIEGALLWREVVLRSEIVLRHGIACTRVERAVFDEMRRTTSVRIATQVLEMAMHAELTSLARFAVHLTTRNRRKRVGIARKALALAVEGAESPQETLMRLVWVLDAELPTPLCNVNVYDREGGFLGRPDLFDPVAGLVGEYDGAHHRLASVKAHDVPREEGFRRHGLEYFTVVEGDLRNRPLLAARMSAARARALGPRRAAARDWTLVPPDGLPPLTLDRRLELRDLLASRR